MEEQQYNSITERTTVFTQTERCTTGHRRWRGASVRLSQSAILTSQETRQGAGSVIWQCFSSVCRRILWSAYVPCSVIPRCYEGACASHRIIWSALYRQLASCIASRFFFFFFFCALGASRNKSRKKWRWAPCFPRSPLAMKQKLRRMRCRRGIILWLGVVFPLDWLFSLRLKSCQIY